MDQLISVPILLCLCSAFLICQSTEDSPHLNETLIKTVHPPSPPKRFVIRVRDMPEPFESRSAFKPPKVIPIPKNPVLKVPKGFTVNVFAEDLTQPRWLALTPTGDVLVTETPLDQITILIDKNKDGVADETATFATDSNSLNIPFGMAFTRKPGRDRRAYYFFVGNTNEVRRYNYRYGDRNITGSGKRIATLPGHGYRQHWTRNVIASPSGRRLYVSVGSRGNVAEEPLPRAAVIEMDLNGKKRRIHSSGLRNPVGLDFQPRTFRLFTTVNERDGLGDGLVPDYFTRIRRGEFYGWPYTYMSPKYLDPRMLNRTTGKSLNEPLARKTKTPDVLFRSHSAALGLKFYNGRTFPRRYRGGAFVAFRGSWNRSRGTGYKLVFIPFNKRTGKPRKYYEDFLTGFLSDPTGPKTWGRPVGLLMMPDGSLLFTEEPNGRIYRVQYKKKKRSG